MRLTTQQRSADLINMNMNMVTFAATLLFILSMCQAGAKPLAIESNVLVTSAAATTTSFQSQAQLPQWDLAVAHGDNISLITFDKSNPNGIPTIQEILIPFPVNSAAAALYQARQTQTVMPAVPAPASARNSPPKLPFGQIEYIATDSSRQLIFYTYLYMQPASYKQRTVRYRDLNAYSLATKESVRLAQAINNNATFDDLLYSDNDNSLYWIDAKANYIVQMQLRLNPSSSAMSTPVPVGEPIARISLAHVPGRHVTFDGLAIDPRTGYTYYGAWGSPSFGKSAIYYYDGNSSRLLLSEGIHSPTSLTVTPDSHLYWVNKPPGSQQHAIERVKLTAGDDEAISASRDVVYSGQRQHWFEFMISCTKPGSNLFYTDITSRSLYQVDTSTGEQTLIKKYYPNVPQGMAASHPAWTSHDNPLCSARATASTSITSATATAKVPSASTLSSTSTEISTITANVNKNGPIPSASNQFVFYSCSPVEQLTNPCFNGGACISTDSDADVRTHCLCTADWTGPTCEIQADVNVGSQLQGVSLNNPHLDLEYGNKKESNTVVYLAVIIVLGILVVLLLFSVGILGFKVCRLTRKPTIRRRVIVSRNNNGARVRKASGHGQNGDGGTGNHTVCELIDIENCCNMNICETPCYDTGIMKTGDKEVMDSMSSDLDIASSGSGDDKQQLIV